MSRDRNGYPVSPVDEIMRARSEGRASFSDRAIREELVAQADGQHPTPPRGSVWGFAAALILIVMVSVLLTACGGKVQVDITEDPPIIRYIKEFCAAPPQDRFRDLLQLNQAVEGEGAFAMACPDTDIVQMSFQEGEYLGVPAKRIFADFYYLTQDQGPVSRASRSEWGKPLPGHLSRHE